MNGMEAKVIAIAPMIRAHARRGPLGNEVFVPGGLRSIRSAGLDQPLDLAPVRIETTHPNRASNTTLQLGSDF
jgi:hypothetical protein